MYRTADLDINLHSLPLGVLRQMTTHLDTLPILSFGFGLFPSFIVILLFFGYGRCIRLGGKDFELCELTSATCLQTCPSHSLHPLQRNNTGCEVHSIGTRSLTRREL